jgi:hypothetical protein
VCQRISTGIERNWSESLRADGAAVSPIIAKVILMASCCHEPAAARLAAPSSGAALWGLLATPAGLSGLIGLLTALRALLALLTLIA